MVRVPHDEAARVKQWIRGHRLAAARQLELDRAEGARPAQAVAEALSAVNALLVMDPSAFTRDAASERAIDVVRRRWARAQHRAKQAAQR